VDGPVQVTPALVKLAVTVIVAVTGALVVFIAVKLAILPLPLAANPTEGVLFVQLCTSVPPVAVLLKVIAVVDALLHTTWLATELTIGIGLTVIVWVHSAKLPHTSVALYVLVIVYGAVVLGELATSPW
jgi:hypothetical protein